MWDPEHVSVYYILLNLSPVKNLNRLYFEVVTIDFFIYDRLSMSQVDGMDVLAVRSATEFARDYCTSDKGPLVIEAATYRYSGHSMSDPGTSYRTRDEIQEVRQTRDPITSFREKILNTELVHQDELKVILKKIALCLLIFYWLNWSCLSLTTKKKSTQNLIIVVRINFRIFHRLFFPWRFLRTQFHKYIKVH